MPGTVEIRWRRLRYSLAVFTAATLAGGTAAAAAWWQEHRAIERLEAAETRLAAARGRYAALSAEREKWRRFGPLYRRLAAQGRLGGEQPARWTDAVKNAMAGVPAARYRFGSTHVVENDGPAEVRATDLSLDLEMRHEAELTRFLAALEREAPGTFTVSGCRLVRTDVAGAREPPRAAAAGDSHAVVDAACRIRWQSVVLSGTGPGWTPAAGLDGGKVAAAAWAGSEAAPVEPPRDTFGRLFTTAAERARIDAALVAGAVARETDEAPSAAPVRSGPPAQPGPVRWVRIGGIVARSGRSVFAWIDGRRVAYGDPPPKRPALARISLQLPAADANLLAVTRRTPSSRFDSASAPVSTTTSAARKRSFGPCALSQRHLDARSRKPRRAFRVSTNPEKFTEFFEYATKVGEICGPAEPLATGIRVDAGGRSILVRPGQRFDPRTGAVSDPIRRPKDRSRRARSLRESSTAPLTDPATPGQN